MMVTKPPKYHQNLTLGERKALQDFSQDSSIVIHPVDKGGTTVIQSYQDYRREILRQLDDHTTYTRLTFDPVKKFQTRIKNQIDLGILNGFLDEKMAHPKHPVLYTLPKIHKDPKTPPGRPIVSAKESLLEPVVKYVDFYIKDSIVALPTCLRDTRDFIQKINLSPMIK
ncbi:Hypothetical predicted protein [Pelobates cultripes]|uniref:Reverse transcriptase n=1 Tax=Pelobates cultripes TaxID=61616 RepID=A0AAD1RRF5_PELCU|nr:Hypothetical predicted protein [Pelobates cultripes]